MNKRRMKGGKKIEKPVSLHKDEEEDRENTSWARRHYVPKRDDYHPLVAIREERNAV